MKAKKIKPLRFLLTLTLILIVFVSYDVVAQTPPAPQAPQGPPQAPIDGGILILLAAGVSYGIKKATQKDS